MNNNETGNEMNQNTETESDENVSNFSAVAAKSVRGKKVDPEILAKYTQITKILKERPNEFSRAELCQKHSVNYHNFSQWYAKQQQRVQAALPPRFKPNYQPPIVGQSTIMTTVDNLMECLTPMIRDAIKTAILEGIKLDKIKAIR